MARIGVIAPPFPGHLDPLRALAAELAARGHAVTLVQQADAARGWRGEGLGFVPIGARTHPPGSLEAVVARMAVPAWRGLRATLRDVAASASMVVREAPAALRAERVDLLLADQAQWGAARVGALLDVPVVATATALPLDREPGLPPPWLGWRPAADAAGRARIEAAWRIVDRLMRPVEAAVEEAVRDAAVGAAGPGASGPGGGRARGAASARAADTASNALRARRAAAPPVATLAQAIAGADFPRVAPPPGFAYCGPWRGPVRADPAVERALDAERRPLAFVSLGTLQGSRGGLFAAIAAACDDLGLRAVVAHGGRLDARTARALPGAPLVFDFVPQRAVLARCALAVTHCGFNTVLDALEAGVPMVALPLAFEQPGTAARLVHAGVAEAVSPPWSATRGRVRRALARALGGPHRVRARERAAEVAAAGGVRAAADRIEAVLRAGAGTAATRDASLA